MVFGLFKKNRDTTQIDSVLAEIERLGRRLGNLISMNDDERARVIRIFTLDVITDTMPHQKSLLIDTRQDIAAGKMDSRSVGKDLEVVSECVAHYHSYLDGLNKMGEEPNNLFIERAGIGSYF